MYLSDLTFIEDANSNMLPNDESLINFSKRMKTAEVIWDLQQFQAVPYPFEEIPELQIWINNEMQYSSTIAELYDLSTCVEPRDREDEKMYSSIGIKIITDDIEHDCYNKVDFCQIFIEFNFKYYLRYCWHRAMIFGPVLSPGDHRGCN